MPILDKKKKALEAYRDKLLTEIFNYDKRIVQARKQLELEQNESSSFEDYESSDSDSELSLPMDSGPPISQLKSQHDMLKTCLRATQELTELKILQSEVNVLVQSPVFEGESPITKPGTWREVIAECCLDLVPFSITFYAHRGEGTFAPILYRGLKVSLTKPLHEAELATSVLPRMRKPSDAVEVVRNYAVAHRSRRLTLSKLAEMFGSTIFMEPMANGGYLLKYANLLEASWTLQNKWGPIASFHHRLKFDLEYIDESYIKTIKQVHSQLSASTVNTEERTRLLAKIISTCRAALPLQPDTSDQDAGDMASPVKGRVERRRTTMDTEPDAPNMMNKKDSEVMSPPKSLPKKVKMKNKSPSVNKIADPKPPKRLQENKSNDNVKKPKIDNNKEEYAETEVEVDKKTESTAKNSKSVASDKNNVHNVNTGKNKEEKITPNTKSDGDKANVDKAKIITVNKDVAAKIQSLGNAKKAGKAKIANKPANIEKLNENPGKKDEKIAAKNIGAAAMRQGTVKNDNTENVEKDTCKKKEKTNKKPYPSY